MANDLITEKEEKQILLTMASILKNNCENQSCCKGCSFYDKDENYPVCVLMMRSPVDWDLDHIS